MLRLSNSLDLKNNTFNNNQQITTSSPSLTVGSAISVDRYLGANPLHFDSNIFTNHVGINSAQIPSLEAYINIQTTNPTPRTLENRSTPPLITFSIWENFAGVTYFDSLEFGTPVDTRSRSSVSQGKLGPLSSVNFKNCYFEGNVFSSGKTSQLSISDTGGAIIWYFKDINRESGSFEINRYGNGQLSSNIRLGIVGSRFFYNHVLDDRSLIQPINFAFFSIDANMFYANLIVDWTENTKNAYIGLILNTDFLPSGQMTNNTWVFNFGRILFFEGIEKQNLRNTILLEGNTISSHISLDSVIHTQYVSNLKLLNTTAQNISSRVSFLNVKSVYQMKIQMLSINKLITDSSGCLSIDRFTPNLQIDDFTCSYSHLIIPATFGDSILRPFSACFSLRNQYNVTEVLTITFSNIICESPMITYQNPNEIQPGVVKAHCFNIYFVGYIEIDSLSCMRASYVSSLDDRNLLLGYIGQATSVYFYGGIVEENNAYASIYLSRSQVTFHYWNVVHNSVQALATFVYARNQASLYIKDSILSDNQCNKCSAMISTVGGNQGIGWSTFTDNYAYGPLIDTKLGAFSISRSTFIRNKALSETAILNSIETDVYIYGSTLIANEGLSHIISLYGGENGITSSDFIDSPTITSGESYIKIVEAKNSLFVYNCYFVASSFHANNRKGGFFEIINSNIDIATSSFENGYAQKGGAIYFSGKYYHLGVYDCVFKSNTARFGGALFVISNNLIINICSFENNQAKRQGGSLWASDSLGEIRTSNLTTIGGQTLYFETSQFEVIGVILQGNRLSFSDQVNGSTSAIYAIDSNFTVRESNITGFNYDESQPNKISSAVYLTSTDGSTSLYDFEDVQFQNNIGEVGGAIHAQDVKELKFQECTFQENIAKQGGAIFYQAKNIGLTAHNSLFIQNQATISGGAIQYIGKGSNILLENVGFVENSAPYGEDLGSYGLYLEQISFDQSLYESYRHKTDSRLLLEQNDTGNSSEYQNGKIMNPPLMFVLKDKLGEIVYTDNSSKVIVSATKTGTSSTSPLIEGIFVYTAYKGHFILDLLKIYFGPYGGVKLRVKLIDSPVLAYYRSNDEEYDIIQAGTEISIPARNCSLGEILTVADTCVSCQRGEYTLDQGSRSACTKCPVEGICDGSFIYGPQPSYSRFSDRDNKLNKCRNNVACLGAVLLDKSLKEKTYCPESQLFNESFCFVGWCNEGYQGNLCAECREGWGLDNSALGTCGLCHDNIVYYVIQSLLALASVGYIFYFIKSSLKREEAFQICQSESKPVKYLQGNKTNSQIPVNSCIERQEMVNIFTFDNYDPKEAKCINERKIQDHNSILSPMQNLQRICTSNLLESNNAPRLEITDNQSCLEKRIKAESSKISRSPSRDPYRNLGDIMSVARNDTYEQEDATLKDVFEDINIFDGCGNPSEPKKKRMYRRSVTNSSFQQDRCQLLEMRKTNTDTICDTLGKKKISAWKDITLHKSQPSQKEVIKKNSAKFSYVSRTCDRDMFRNQGDIMSVARSSTIDDGEETISDIFMHKNPQIDDTARCPLKSREKRRITKTMSFSYQRSHQVLGIRKINTEKLQTILGAKTDMASNIFHSVELISSSRSLERSDDVPNVVPKIDQNLAALTIIYLKIFTSYIHVIAIIGILDINWPRAYNDYFEFYKTVPQNSAQIFSFDCLLRKSFLSTLGLRIFSIKLIIISISPIVFTILVGLFWTIFFITRYGRRLIAMNHKIKKNITISLMVVFFVLYPILLQASLETFSCGALGDNSDSTYLDADPQMKCWESEHLQILFSVALPSLVIWGVITPLASFGLLFLERNHLREQLVEDKLGFLSKGFKQSYFYWELVIICRKIALIIVVSPRSLLDTTIKVFFLSCSVLFLKAAMTLGINGLFYVLHIKKNPYSSDKLNQLEKNSLVISTITIYCGMYYLSDSISSAVVIILMILLTISNVLFYLYWLVEFLKIKSQEFLRRPLHTKCCKRVLEFFANFEWRIRKRNITKTDCCASKKISPPLLLNGSERKRCEDVSYTLKLVQPSPDITCTDRDEKTFK